MEETGFNPFSPPALEYGEQDQRKGLSPITGNGGFGVVQSGTKRKRSNEKFSAENDEMAPALKERNEDESEDELRYPSVKRKRLIVKWAVKKFEADRKHQVEVAEQ